MTNRKRRKVWNGRGWVDAEQPQGCGWILGSLMVLLLALFVIVQGGVHL